MKTKTKLLKIIILAIEILAILATLPVLYIGIEYLGFRGFVDLNPLPILLLVVLPLLFIIISVYILTKTLKTKEAVAEIVSDYKKINAPLLISYLLVSVVLIPFISFAAYSLFTEKPPVFFPFDDKLASYTVTRENGLYLLYYDTISDRNKDFGRNIRIIIGKSDIDLQSFIGKKVIIDDGEFVSTKQQCIAGRCIDINTESIGGYVALDIKSIHQTN